MIKLNLHIVGCERKIVEIIKFYCELGKIHVCKNLVCVCKTTNDNIYNINLFKIIYCMLLKHIGIVF